jgi:hypothetical protein
MNVDIYELKKANDELKFVNHSFDSAEKIAGFGHWKLNLETKEYSFSNNFYRLLGEEMGTFEPNLENITKRIHPDDVAYVIETHKKSLATFEDTSLMFRFVLPNGENRYIMAVGNFTKNSHLIIL